MPVEQIQEFINRPESGRFEDLALQAFARRWRDDPLFRGLCERRGQSPDRLTDWSRIPLVPTVAFKSLDLAIAPPQATFMSSGTSAAGRSTHPHPFLDLYRATIDASFPRHCLPAGHARLPMLSLVPSRKQLPESSLSFMIDHVVESWGDSDNSLYAIGPRGIDGRTMRTWIAGCQRAGVPVLLLTTSLALNEALDALDRLGVRFRLPTGSVLFETGGFKGHRLEVDPSGLEDRVETTLGLPRQRIVREYGMTELTSQFYTGALASAAGVDTPAETGHDAVYRIPHWVRVRILDPESLEPVEAGRTGLIAIFDLANLGTALHLLTEDLGSLGERGLRLHGRATGAELRGCSLAAEELTAQSAEPG